MGYVAPSAAAAFLKLARTGAAGLPSDRDPLTRAYFRELTRAPPQPDDGRPPFGPSGADDLAALLHDEGVLEEREERPRLPASSAAREEPLVVRTLRRLAEEDPAQYAQRNEELAYLANVLVAGAAPRRGRLRPVESLEAVIAAVDLGLELALERTSPKSRGGDAVPAATALLRSSGADALFRLAWQRLCADAAGGGGKADIGDILEALAAR